MEQNLALQIAVGVVLLRERRKRHLTQQNLADQSRLQRVYLVGIESGKRSVSLTAVFALSQALGISPAEFVEKVMKEIEKSKD